MYDLALLGAMCYIDHQLVKKISMLKTGKQL